MGRIILLTEPACVDAVVPRLMAADATVDVAVTRGDLEAALRHGGDARVLAFGSGVIVPPFLLNVLKGPAYNLHPGPPAYPGLYPSVYALYENAPAFGVTLHELIAEVDSGPIVAVDTFAIPAGYDRLALDTLCFEAMLAMLTRFAPALADLTQPLPRTTDTWTGRRRTRADFTAMCQLPEDVTADEFHRRLRAVGEGPEHALTITRFGRKFTLMSEAAGPVVRGGQPS